MNILLIEKQLRDLGFSDHEAKIYLQLLKLSPTNASLLAKKTNIPRSSVYLAMNELSAKGLASVTFKNGVRQFMAENPSVIKELLQKDRDQISRKLTAAENILGTLQLMRKSDLHIPNIVFFEGMESLKKIYLGMLREGHQNSTMLIIRDEYVWRPEWQFIFKEEWHDLVRKIRTERNISTRLLMNDSKEEHKHLNYYNSRKALSFRHLPKNQLVHDFVIYILNDITSILSLEKNNVVGIKITNEHITKNFTALFEGLWNKGKK